MGIPYGHMFRAAGIPGRRNPTEEGGPSIRGTLDINLRLVRRIHMNRLWDAFLRGKAGGYPADIKMAWFAGGNPLNQRGNANKGAQALKSLEFTVVQDIFLTPTARYADVVLPVKTFAEKNDLTRPWPSGPYLCFANQAIEALGECKSDWEIGNLLADKLGFKNADDKSEEEWLRTFVTTQEEYQRYIKDYDQFKKESVHRIELKEPYIAFKRQIDDPEHNKFETPSGKIEIYSQRLADLHNPLTPAVPKYIAEGREDRNHPLAAKYPLQMLSPHPRVRVHSTLQNVDWLDEVDPHVMWINPRDAAARGVRDGDTVLVFNDRGTLAIKAWVTRRIVPGVVSIYEGHWYDPDGNGIDRGGCANTLTDDAYSPGGAATLKTVLVDVKREG
jgi:anaerobic dimethyl sulfoxide reductase subunit A